MNKVSLFFMAAVLTAGMVFTGCNKDDEDGGTSALADNKITATVVNGASYSSAVDNVKALMNEYEEYDEDLGRYVWTGYTAGSGAYTSGGFTISLTATIEAQYLGSEVEAEEGITISDPAVKIGYVEHIIAYKSDVEVGDFTYCNYDPNGDEPASGADGYYLYVDRDVNITGSESNTSNGYTETYTANMSLKKGWNIVYDTWNYNEAAKTATYTTKTGAAPSGMKWYFYPDIELSSLSAKAASPRAAGRKTLFGRLK
jgi:hypothetical protein